MSDLDDELRAALSDSEAQAQELATSGPVPGDAPGVTLTPDGAGVPQVSKRGLGLLAALLLAGAGILTLIFTSVDEAAIYSVTVDKLLAESGKFADRNVRVEGALVKGSLQHRAEPCEYRFTVEKNGATLPVRYAQCVVPDTFRDVPYMDVQVTAEGRLHPDGHFEANQIMAKCPSKYEMGERNASGQSAPHAIVDGPAPAAPSSTQP